MESPNLNRAIQLFENGRYEQAIPFLQKALSEDAEEFETKYYLAHCFFQTDSVDKALQLGIELRRLEPNDANVHFLLSQIYLHQDNITEAERSIDKAIAIYPYAEHLFGQKAYIFLAKKEFEKALQYANEGLNIDPKSSFCLNARTTALTKLNRKEEAKASIEYLLQDNPEDAHSHANVGWSALEHNDTKKALTHFKEALILNPNLEYARSGMITAIKSKNKIYNLYLRYAFWMSKKSEKNQWFFVIGIYFAYRFSVKILSATGMTYLAIPLIIAYLLFALGSWIMDPLSNMILLFDKYGKFLLNKKDKLSGQLFFGALMAAVLSFATSLVFASNYFTMLSLAFLAAILPLTRGAMADRQNNEFINYAYGAFMIAIALIGPLIGFPQTTVGIIVGVMFIGYTWLGGLISK
ncbi:hypothetical protein MHTCC0001_06020 [Flavobacteriaceae bacterium MHTCC 0001]